MCDPVGMPEIAVRAGVAASTVRVWRLRGRLPEPRWTVGGSAAWDWDDIVAAGCSTGAPVDNYLTRFLAHYKQEGNQ